MRLLPDGRAWGAVSGVSIDEYLRLIGIFVSLASPRCRLTAAKPLLRRGIVELVQELGRLRTPSGESLDLALTTNATCWTVCRRRSRLPDCDALR